MRTHTDKKNRKNPYQYMDWVCATNRLTIKIQFVRLSDNYMDWAVQNVIDSKDQKRTKVLLMEPACARETAT